MDTIYFLWLSLNFEFGSYKPYKILTIYSDPKSFYDSLPFKVDDLDFLNAKEIERLNRKSLNEAKYVMSLCEKYKIKIVTICDLDFPNLLKNIYSPPILIYYRGDISCINDSLCISIVGTRTPSEYGKYVTGNISYQLAKHGVCIVSGFAVGIDNMAHVGALKAGGKTVAVLACGLNINYPSANKNLKAQIEKNGVLISELPPDTKVKSNIFKIRNRIISGISKAVLIAESPLKSGSHLTSKHAIDQNRDLFCIPPHNIYDRRYYGVVKYLRDGAIPVYSFKDILAEYIDLIDYNCVESLPKEYEIERSDSKISMVADNSLNYLPNNDSVTEELDERSLKIYQVLSDSPKHVETIVEKSNTSLSETLSVLTELEILGLIESYGGNRYGINKKGDKQWQN